MPRYRFVIVTGLISLASLGLTGSAHAASIQGGAAPATIAVANRIAAKSGFSGALLGRADRPNNPRSDHPRGLAVDFMVDSRAEGDRVAAACRSEQQVSYVLWRVKDHHDHVHCSFKS